MKGGVFSTVGIAMSEYDGNLAGNETTALNN
jgi:hypothetical protein